MLKQIVKTVGKASLFVGGGYLCYLCGRIYEVQEIAKSQRLQQTDLNNEYQPTPTFFGYVRVGAVNGVMTISSVD